MLEDAAVFRFKRFRIRFVPFHVGFHLVSPLWGFGRGSGCGMGKDKKIDCDTKCFPQVNFRHSSLYIRMHDPPTRRDRKYKYVFELNWGI
jgi:hypothetical protein